MPDQYDEKQVSKVVMVRQVPGDDDKYEINTTQGFGSDVNVTNPELAVISGTEPLNAEVTNFPATQQVAGTVGVDNFPAIQEVFGDVAVTGEVVTLPYNVRTLITYNASGKAEYIGQAPQTTATSAPTWVVKKIVYNASNKPIDIQVLVGVWDDRTTLGWV